MNQNSNSDEYFIQQFSTGCLAQFAYYIESNKEAAVIDPLRDCDEYVQILEQRGAKLKYILETHFHADFVSGHVELNKLTGAQIVFGPTAKADFEFMNAEDEQLLSLGNINIKVIHTPGHTLESVSYLVLESKGSPKAVFTGDCVFLGDVGRPDLAVGGTTSQNDLAGLLYDSIQKIKSLPDDVVLYPGHGAGSACGKKISQGSSCTIGIQKKNNYALNDNLSKQEFIEIVTSNLPSPPQYFFHGVLLNKKGYQQISSILEKSLKPVAPEEFFKLVDSKECEIVDNRDFLQSIKCFFRGSYLISLKMQYAIWTATCFSPEQKLIIICDAGKEKESITRLCRVGFENVVGYVEGGFEALFNYANQNGLQDQFVTMNTPDLNNIKETLEENFDTKANLVIDVREEAEITDKVQDADVFPLSQLVKNVDEILSEIQGKRVAIYCRTGGRASLAASILAKNGVNDLTFYGGILNMQEKKVNLAKIN